MKIDRWAFIADEVKHVTVHSSLPTDRLIAQRIAAGVVIPTEPTYHCSRLAKLAAAHQVSKDSASASPALFAR